MAASVDDVVLTSFVADSEGLKDLDSIVRQRCQDMGSTGDINYKVTRRDSLQYTTEDIEEVLKERNGKETHIESVVMQAEVKQTGLKFAVTFDEDVTISGESGNRANLVLLTSDVRALLHDRMKSRGASNSRTRAISAVAAFIVGMFGFMQFTSAYSNNNLNKSQAQYSQSAIVRDKQMRQENADIQGLVTQYRQSPPSGTVDALGFLAQAEMLQLRIVTDQNNQNINTPVDNYNNPWWVDTFFLPFLIGAALSGLVYGIGYLLYPPGGAVFLIGDEIRRQARLAQIRERLVWGIGVSFILGIASGIATTAIF